MKQADYELQKKASKFRSENGIGTKEPVQFKWIFNRLCIVSVFRPMSESFSGMSIKIDNAGFLLINSSHPVGRQNFTICHELFHLFVQENFQSHTCDTGRYNRKDKNEYDADKFASFLLMPEEGLLDLIPESELKKKNSITLPTFLRIEQIYSCSRTALIYRLDNLGLISAESYEDYRNDISKEARKHGFDPSLYMPDNKNLVFGDYGELAKRLFDADRISETHYAKLMRDIGIDIDDDFNNYDRS